MKKFKVGNKVRTKEDHKYLGVTKKATGIVVSSYKIAVEVKFSKIRHTIIFFPEELISVK